MNPFSIKDVREAGSALIVELQGSLTMEAEQPLLNLRDWKRGLGGSSRTLVFDFRLVSSFSSSGIRVLTRIVRWGADGGYQSFAHGLTEQYQRLFRMLGLTTYLMIYPDEYSILQRLEA
ncbi:STAS domain-containing protein [Paenibacillus piri]|uniref:Anti-sigma factor antagonist n=1 Tax=Paenibacillus piri TaxID=2547395 RepID=A0A4R5KDR9_9BACL|nr:STAS domain-containing protein [Paenibacillus piri]TDF93451.1 anti-sigma factor antagonist [Paenibacillus piri]